VAKLLIFKRFGHNNRLKELKVKLKVSNILLSDFSKLSNRMVGHRILLYRLKIKD